MVSFSAEANRIADEAVRDGYIDPRQSNCMHCKGCNMYTFKLRRLGNKLRCDNCCFKELLKHRTKYDAIVKNHPKVGGEPIYINQRLYYEVDGEVIWFDVEFWDPPSEDYDGWIVHGKNQHEEFTNEPIESFRLKREPTDTVHAGDGGEE